MCLKSLTFETSSIRCNPNFDSKARAIACTRPCHFFICSTAVFVYVDDFKTRMCQHMRVMNGTNRIHDLFPNITYTCINHS